MTQPSENRGIRWLAIFEQSASVLLAALLLGMAATYKSVIETNETVNSLADRFDRFDQSTNSRIQNIERDVKEIQIEMAKRGSGGD